MGFDIGPSIGITGEAEFKTALKNINSQFKELGSEMKLATSQFDKNDKSVSALTAKNKVLTKELDSQKGKISLLTGEYGKQKSTLGELENKLDSAKKAFGENSDEVRKAQREYDQQSVKVNGLKTDLNNATANLNKMDRELASNNTLIRKSKAHFGELGATINSKVNKAFKGMAVGVAAVTAGLAAMVTTAVANADAIEVLASTTGLSAERLQELQYVGAKVDVELTTMTGAQTKLIKSMAAAQGGTKAQAEAFGSLGIAVTDSNGNLRDSNTVFTEAITALGNMKNPTERNATAMTLFGKSAMKLNPLITTSAGELSKLTKEAHDSGAVVSNETMGAIDEFGDSMAAMKLQVTGVISNALAPLMPKLQGVADKLANMDTKPITEAVKWAIDHGATLGKVILGIVAALVTAKTIILASATATAALSIAHGIQAAATGIATAAQWAWNAAMTANPIGLVIVAIAALIAAIVLIATHWKQVTKAIIDAWDKVKKVFEPVAKWFSKIFTAAFNGIKKAFSGVTGFFKGIWDEITGIFKKIGTTIGNGIGGAFKAVVNSVISFAEKMINDFIRSINLAIRLINKIPGVEISQIKELNIPKMNVGTRYLPSDMLVYAHQGEMIVPKSENPYANSGGAVLNDSSGEIVTLLKAILDKTGNDMVLDTGTLVGSTAPLYDKALGKLARRK